MGLRSEPLREGWERSPCIAWLKDGIDSDASVKDGVVSNKFTGDWVVMAVPVCAGIRQYGKGQW